jgi:MFS family permease
MAHTIAHDVAAEGSEPGSIWGGANRSLTAGLLLTIVGVAFEALAVATVMPATARDLGGLALYGWAFSAFMLANLVGITLSGAEADRRGPARPFLVGVALFALGLTIAGLAPRMEIVILGRTVQGFGAGFISSIVYVVIGRGYTESARPRMLAMTSTAWVVPGLIGPAIAGLVADHIGWRWVFLGLVPLQLIAASMAWPGMRRLARTSDAVRDWRPVLTSLRLAIGAGLLLTGLSVAVGAGDLPGRPYIVGALVVVGAALGWPALRRLLPPGTLRAAPGLPAAVAAHGLLNLAFFGVDAFVPLGLIEGRGQSATVAGLALTAATITWTSGSWIQAYFAQRGLRRPLSLAGLALIIVGVAGIIVVLAPTTPIWLAPAAWGVAGLGIGMSFSTHSLTVLEMAPRGQEGSASAALQLANVLGVALGTGVGGVIIGATSASGGPQMGITIQSVLMIGVTVLAMAAALRLPQRREATREPAPAASASEAGVAQA